MHWRTKRDRDIEIKKFHNIVRRTHFFEDPLGTGKPNQEVDKNKKSPHLETQKRSTT